MFQTLCYVVIVTRTGTIFSCGLQFVRAGVWLNCTVHVRGDKATCRSQQHTPLMCRLSSHWLRETTPALCFKCCWVFSCKVDQYHTIGFWATPLVKQEHGPLPAAGHLVCPAPPCLVLLSSALCPWIHDSTSPPWGFMGVHRAPRRSLCGWICLQENPTVLKPDLVQSASDVMKQDHWKCDFRVIVKDKTPAVG